MAKRKNKNYRIEKSNEKFNKLPDDISDKTLAEVVTLLQEYAATHKNGAYVHYMGKTLISKDLTLDKAYRIMLGLE